MTRLRWALFAGLLALSVALAFFLQDLVYRNLIIPLAYIWWTLEHAYRLVPQLFLWMLLLAVVFMLIIGNLAMEAPRTHRRGVKAQPVRGRVELMTAWLIGADKGNYFKWLIANRLSGIAREVEGGPGRHPRTDFGVTRPAVSSDSGGRQALEDYLDAGLNQSFGEYPNPRHWFQRRRPTPLDLDPAEAVDYLESLMEERLDRRS